MVLPVYDLGCFDGIGSTPLNKWANLHLRGQVWADSLTAFLHRAGQTKMWWDTLDPVSRSAEVLCQQIFWGPRGVIAIAVLAFGFFTLRRARNGEVSVAAHLATVGLGVIMLGQITAFHGVDTTHWLRDHLVAFTTAFDGGAYNVESDVEARQLRYRTWQAAMFGDADTPVANEYGPRLLDCFTYQWDDPQTRDKEAEKQACIRQTMDELHDKHPVESSYAHGAKTTEQWWTTGEGFWWGTVPKAIWQIIAGFCGILLFLVATFIVPFTAFVAPYALFKAREVLWPMFRLFVNLLGMTCGCQIVAQLVAAAEGAILGASQIPWLLRLVFCVAIPIAVWVLARSLRRPLNGWGAHKAGHGAVAAVKGAVRTAEFAATITAGLPPSILENLGGMSAKQAAKQAAGATPAVAAKATETPRPSWTAPPWDPPLPLPAGQRPAGQDSKRRPAAGVAAAGRPPVAWAHHQTGPAPGPGTFQRADGTWATRDTGTRPVAALGPGVFALGPGTGTVIDPAIHDPRMVEARSRLDRLVQHARAANRAADNATVTDFDRHLTGMYVADGADKPALDVRGWVAPPTQRRTR